MECCGNTIKDLYGFSCPLKCSTYILQSVKYYKEVSADETNINVVKGVSDIYNAMFNDQEQAVLKISDQCVIDFPSRYKKRLIDACSLLSPKTKLD
ncbi:hypothetical protein LRLP16767_LRLP167_00572 [Limosilactobacillus reuteri]|uniref:Uncharacterized protein n=1 Tax=Limosilactobacillus reuteri TaxID=1598 RepID=A0A0U5JZF9_LIMRT|nr:hypothetical protein LRLP16767_LRLP167_00572 [Limosilactobacillus reuteri]